jgi:hypothetical protein
MDDGGAIASEQHFLGAGVAVTPGAKARWQGDRRPVFAPRLP